MSGRIIRSFAIVISGSTLIFFSTAKTEAGGPHPRRGTVSTPTVRYFPTNVIAQPPLGSGFVSTPYINVRGNGTAGGGYSPLGQFGDTTMVIHGPLSVFRSTSAPIAIYSRGYDGRITEVPATSFSSPNQPRLSPVVYPTQATNYYGFRQSGSPPWWQNATNWIDQN